MPSFCTIAWLGAGALTDLLLIGQVVLSFQLPFAVWLLIRLTSDRKLMGLFASGAAVQAVA